MKIEGQRTFAANREVLWSLLHDPYVLKRCWPGCESLEAIGSDEYRAVLEIRIGQVIERFDGTLHLEHVVPYQGYRFVADGQNSDGSIVVRGRIVLEEAAGGGTTLSYETDVNVSGRPATVSSRRLITTARAFARCSLDALEKEAAVRTRVYTTTTAEPDETFTPSAGAVRHMVQRRRWLMLVLTLLGALVLWRRLERRPSRVARQVVDLVAQAPVDGASLPARAAFREAA